MKFRFIYTLAILFMLAGCAEDQLLDPENNIENNQESVILSVSMPSNPADSRVSYDGNQLTWDLPTSNNGDVLYLVGLNSQGEYIGMSTDCKILHVKSKNEVYFECKLVKSATQYYVYYKSYNLTFDENELKKSKGIPKMNYDQGFASDFKDRLFLAAGPIKKEDLSVPIQLELKNSIIHFAFNSWPKTNDTTLKNIFRCSLILNKGNSEKECKMDFDIVPYLTDKEGITENLYFAFDPTGKVLEQGATISLVLKDSKSEVSFHCDKKSNTGKNYQVGKQYDFFIEHINNEHPAAFDDWKQ